MMVFLTQKKTKHTDPLQTLENQYFDPQNEAGFSGARNLIRINKKKIPDKKN